MTTCGEVVLHDLRAHASHPVFSKLFLQTEWVAPAAALLVRRRPREPQEQFPWLVHASLDPGRVEFETDRARFVGRGSHRARPAALRRPGPLGGGAGNVLDPVVALRREVTLTAGVPQTLAFLLGAAASREDALALVTAAGGRADAHRPHAPVQTSAVPDVSARGAAPQFANGLGAFSDDGREYVLHLRRREDGTLALPPQPWVNVIANESFGCLVSETGAGTTWCGNSREHRLTPWSNDPVLDPHGDALYVRDDDTGAFCSCWPGPAPGGDYEVRHGFGYTACRHASDGLEIETTVFVARHDPVRITRVSVTQHGPRTPACLPACLCAARPGRDARGDRRHAARRARRPQRRALRAQSCRRPLGRRGGFRHGRHRRRRPARHQPGPLPRPGPRSELAGVRSRRCARRAAGDDAAFVHRAALALPAGESAEFAVLLGQAADADHARRLVAEYSQTGACEAAWREARAFWRDGLGGLHVTTPSPALDLLVNGWLGYQTCQLPALGPHGVLPVGRRLRLPRPVAGRARAAAPVARPRAPADRAARRPPVRRGRRAALVAPAPEPRHPHALRRRPAVAAVSRGPLRRARPATTPCCASRRPTCVAPRLAPGEDEVFVEPSLAGETGDVYDHCCRALDRSLAVGAHGLPLFGTGDWNDGMNRVGREGRGESVWMGFFLVAVIDAFAPLVRRARRHRARRALPRSTASASPRALNDTGWDGGWYLRGYYDDGTPLGSHRDDECRIDALAQAWSVLSGVAPPARAAQVLDAVEAQLISERDGLIRLLTPPFVDTPHDPGYIKGYVAGVRENGGQYTHAALWVVRAMAAGRPPRPRRRAARPAEPDPARRLRPRPSRATRWNPTSSPPTSTAPTPHVGRGGWTWYTGSSGWMLRVALESVLGLRTEHGDTLVLAPCVPDDWPSYQIRWRVPGTETVYDIAVNNPGGCSQRVVAAACDGAPVACPTAASAASRCCATAANTACRSRSAPQRTDRRWPRFLPAFSGAPPPPPTRSRVPRWPTAPARATGTSSRTRRAARQTERPATSPATTTAAGATTSP